MASGSALVKQVWPNNIKPKLEFQYLNDPRKCLGYDKTLKHCVLYGTVVSPLAMLDLHEKEIKADGAEDKKNNTELPKKIKIKQPLASMSLNYYEERQTFEIDVNAEGVWGFYIPYIYVHLSKLGDGQIVTIKSQGKEYKEDVLPFFLQKNVDYREWMHMFHEVYKGDNSSLVTEITKLNKQDEEPVKKLDEIIELRVLGYFERVEITSSINKWLRLTGHFKKSDVEKTIKQSTYVSKVDSWTLD